MRRKPGVLPCSNPDRAIRELASRRRLIPTSQTASATSTFQVQRLPGVSSCVSRRVFVPVGWINR